jgi:hypothetical protein
MVVYVAFFLNTCNKRRCFEIVDLRDLYSSLFDL